MDQVVMSMIIAKISITILSMMIAIMLFTNHNNYDGYVDHVYCNYDVDYEDHNDNNDLDDYDYDDTLHSSSSWPVSTSLSPLTSSR